MNMPKSRFHVDISAKVLFGVVAGLVNVRFTPLMKGGGSHIIILIIYVYKEIEFCE